jgi:hypothetical protein
MSKTVRRSAKQRGSERTTVFPVVSLVTLSSGISTWAWPTRMASIPGTFLATLAAAFYT